MNCETLISRRITDLSKFWLKLHLVVEGKLYALDPSNQPTIEYFGGNGYDRNLAKGVTVHLIYQGTTLPPNDQLPIYNPEIYLGYVDSNYSPSEPDTSNNANCTVLGKSPVNREIEIILNTNTNPATCHNNAVVRKKQYDKAKCGGGKRILRIDYTEV
jgi:hypothetical protein